MSTEPATADDRIPPLVWAMWALAASFYLYGFYQRVLPSVMVDPLMAEFAVGGAVLGNLSAFYFYAYAGLQLPVGMLLDRWGPRRVLTLAAVLCAGGSLLFASADSLTPAYLGRALVGAGAAFSWVGALTIAAAWFPTKRFALLTGLTMLFGMAGAVGGQGPTAALLKLTDWRGVMTWAAIAGFALAGALFLVVRDRRPAGGGGGGASGSAGSVDRAAPVTALAGLGKVARNGQTWLLAFCLGLISAPMLAFGALWGVPYLMQVYGVARAEAAFSISLMLIGFALGGPIVGWVSDHFGRRRPPLLVGIVLMLASLGAALFVPGLPLDAVRALLFLHGLTGGCFVVCFAAVRENNPGSASGTALGLVNMGVMGSGAAFQPIIGVLLDLGWDGRTVAGARVYDAETYRLAFLTLPGALVVAFVLALLIRETWCRPVEAPAPAV